MRRLKEELADTQRMPASQGLSRGYFPVFLEDMDREYEEPCPKGVHFVTTSTTRPSEQRFSFFEDPEGHL